MTEHLKVISALSYVKLFNASFHSIWLIVYYVSSLQFWLGNFLIPNLSYVILHIHSASEKGATFIFSVHLTMLECSIAKGHSV